MNFQAVICVILLSLPLAILQAGEKSDSMAFIDAHWDQNKQVALKIWEYAELGYLEQNSSALLKKTLKDAGFEVESGVAGIPTAFIASAGSGSPVIALLAEYDALPGITQTASPVREEIPGGIAGHACGHHLLGAASLSAALALKNWLEKTGTSGTVRLYGTPAEEGGSGKVYMAREGLFGDVDALLTWHPSNKNTTGITPSLANRSAKFRFRGRSAHASAAPHKGQSALDGVEAFNFMVNLMREHVPQETRIHYVITEGGKAPNVVPDFAEVFYYVRNPDANTLQDIWERVEAAARGAAAGTSTTVDWEVIHGNHPLLPNRVLAELTQANLERIGGIEYDAREKAFAEKIHKTLIDPRYEVGDEERIMPMEIEKSQGSTDVGDLSWLVPTAEIRTATWVPGTPAHSWQAIAAGGTSIGIKGLQLAAKTMALTAQDLYSSPELIRAANAELQQAQGDNFKYVPLLGDRAPPLDYRR